MFYESPEHMSKALRFGDVITGFANCTPNIDTPPLSGKIEYKIDIASPPHFIILSPCCSIADAIVSLAPLLEIKNSIFRNPYFKSDPTNINVKIAPEHSLPPEVWDKMKIEEKTERLSKGPAYTFTELFIYKEHDLFQEYTVSRREGNLKTRYYMIDFRTAFRVNSKSVITPVQSPLECKLLQLTITTRDQLREKIAFYFSRKPKEDIIVSAI